MSATHAHELPTSSPQGEAAGEGRSTSPLLWIALIVAMFAAALVWLRSADTAVMPAPVGERTLPATATPAAAAAPASRVSNEGRTAERRQAPVVRDRQASPLAGNSKPSYPVRALRGGVQGSVVASLNVDGQGNVSEATIVSRTGSRDRDLDREVLRTLQGWKFEPAMRNGRAVASVVRVPVDFRVQQ